MPLFRSSKNIFRFFVPRRQGVDLHTHPDEPFISSLELYFVDCHIESENMVPSGIGFGVPMLRCRLATFFNEWFKLLYFCHCTC